jgi:quercetin dioxygenase-like cupin family protein
LFGGRGAVRVWNLLGAAAPPFTAVLSCELEPGGSVGSHVQQEFPEIVIFLEGEGVAKVDGREHAALAGRTVHLPLGSVLSIENRSGTVPLVYLIIKTRG